MVSYKRTVYRLVRTDPQILEVCMSAIVHLAQLDRQGEGKYMRVEPVGLRSHPALWGYEGSNNRHMYSPLGVI